MATPTLDLLYLDSHSSKNLIIADISQYPTGFNVTTPTIEITVPSFDMKSLAFTERTIQVYNSLTLGITTSDCDIIPLPDGIYKIKYSIFPAYKYYVNKSFLRVDKLLERFDNEYVKLDIAQCDMAIKASYRRDLDVIWDYINTAIASANTCSEKQAMELYNRASDALNKFNKTCNCNG